jgi:hypothetical protein
MGTKQLRNICYLCREEEDEALVSPECLCRKSSSFSDDLQGLLGVCRAFPESYDRPRRTYTRPRSMVPFLPSFFVARSLARHLLSTKINIFLKEVLEREVHL